MKKYFYKIFKGSQAEYFDIAKGYLINNQKKMIITANPEILMSAVKNELISRMILDNDVDIIADGISIVKTSKMYNMPVVERNPGVELAEYLLELSSKINKRVYLFGSSEETINLLIKKLEKEYLGINIIGFNHGYIKNREEVKQDIINKQPDICLVALGVTAQEEFIYSILDQIDKGVYVGVGGSFDVICGQIKRAPKIFLKFNLEWAYRLFREPKRLKRFFTYNINFVMYVIKEKIKKD